LSTKAQTKLSAYEQLEERALSSAVKSSAQAPARSFKASELPVKYVSFVFLRTKYKTLLLFDFN